MQCLFDRFLNFALPQPLAIIVVFWIALCAKNEKVCLVRRHIGLLVWLFLTTSRRVKETLLDPKNLSLISSAGPWRHLDMKWTWFNVRGSLSFGRFGRFKVWFWSTNLDSWGLRFGIFRFVPIPNRTFTHFLIFYEVRTFGLVRGSVFFGRFRCLKFGFRGQT